MSDRDEGLRTGHFRPPMLMTEGEAAQTLCLSQRSLQRLRLSGEGPPFVMLTPGRLAYTVDGLRDWLAQRLVRQNGQQTPEEPASEEIQVGVVQLYEKRGSSEDKQELTFLLSRGALLGKGDQIPNIRIRISNSAASVLELGEEFEIRLVPLKERKK